MAKRVPNMTPSDHFERKTATVCSILVITFGIIFPLGSACSGKFNSFYSSILVIRNGSFFRNPASMISECNPFKISEIKLCCIATRVMSFNPTSDAFLMGSLC